MLLSDLYWMKDTLVKTYWDEHTCSLSVKVMCEGSGECHYLQVFFGSPYYEEKDYGDKYWCVIWAKLLTLKAMIEWAQHTLSYRVQARLAIAYLWDLIRELIPEDNTTAEGVTQMKAELNAIQERIIELHIHMTGITLCNYLYVP